MRRRQFFERSVAAAALAVQPYRAPAADAPPPAKPKIKYAQIGTGHSHAAGKMDAVRRLADLYEVVGYAEADPRRAERARQNRTYQGVPQLTESELLARDDVQVVGIETAMTDSAAAAARAIAAGKHIHLDKPGSLEHDPFRRLRLEAQQRGLAVQMGYMLRYNPAFELLFRLVKAGALGEILEIDCMMGKLAPADLRRQLAELPGAGMFELACHLIDAVVTLVGKPDRVHAFGKQTRAGGSDSAASTSSVKPPAPNAADQLADNQLAVLEYPRATVTIRCNHADPFGGPRRRFQVAGTRGAMEIMPLESGRCRVMLSEPFEQLPKGEQTLALKVPAGRYDGEFADLARVVRGEKQLAWNAEHDIAVHETVLRAAGVWN